MNSYIVRYFDGHNPKSFLIEEVDTLADAEYEARMELMPGQEIITITLIQ